MVRTQVYLILSQVYCGSFARSLSKPAIRTRPSEILAVVHIYVFTMTNSFAIDVFLICSFSRLPALRRVK
jgi:hypothetical protein